MVKLKNASDSSFFDLTSRRDHPIPIESKLLAFLESLPHKNGIIQGWTYTRRDNRVIISKANGSQIFHYDSFASGRLLESWQRAPGILTHRQFPDSKTTFVQTIQQGALTHWHVVAPTARGNHTIDVRWAKETGLTAELITEGTNRPIDRITPALNIFIPKDVGTKLNAFAKQSHTPLPQALTERVMTLR
jgi:hypothetical protein